MKLYIFWLRNKRYIISITVILSIAIIVIGLCLLHLIMKYNYMPESVRDLLYTMNNPPTFEYRNQDIESYPLENGIIIRTNQVHSKKYGTYLMESIGIPGKLGTYYFTNHEEAVCFLEQTDETKRYNKDGSIASWKIEETFMYYYDLGNFRMIVVYSCTPEISDSLNSPRATIFRDDMYFTYLFPDEIDEDYILEYDGSSISGATIMDSVAFNRP